MKSLKHTILLVEDEENFGSVLKNYLELSGYHVTLCTDGKKGLTAFVNTKFDLCLLDVMMPEMDGFSLASEIRKINQSVPLIFLTAKKLKHDILNGYGVGADDYITKPFDTEVLICKIKALINRSQVVETPKTSTYHFGSFQFDVETRILKSSKVQQKLSPKESALLELLCSNINQVVPRDLALNQIWNDNSYFTTRSMDVFITKLRKYLKSDPGIEIINVHGNGFRMIADQSLS